MTERKVVHQIKLDRSVKALLWGFVVAIALNAVPDGFLIEDAMAQAGWPTSQFGGGACRKSPRQPFIYKLCRWMLGNPLNSYQTRQSFKPLENFQQQGWAAIS